MNDLIKWVATHNTLMIQIGFSAIVLLLVVYAFREFFVPKIKVVSDAEGVDGELSELNRESAAKKESDANRTADVEKFKLEVEKLKTQLAESEMQIADLKNKVLEGPSNPQPEKSVKVDDAPSQVKTEASESGSADVKVESASAEAQAANQGISANASTVASGGAEAPTELLQKIESLEARLAEYEIIAEDIAEIGHLRKENDELKKKLSGQTVGKAEANKETVENAAKVEEEVAEKAEAIVDAINQQVSKTEETVSVSEPTTEKIEEIAVTAEQSVENVETLVIESNKTVTENEKDMLSQFEEASEKKESS